MDGTTQRAVNALVAIDDALGRATVSLAAAATTDWVSDAAEGYRRLLGDLELEVGRLRLAVGRAGSVVLGHTRAADVARAVQTATPPQGWVDGWLPGGGRWR